MPNLTKIITTSEYANAVKKSRQAVHKSAKNNRIDLLPGVRKIERANKCYLFVVSVSFSLAES